jgi:NADPH2:quinone reductase
MARRSLPVIGFALGRIAGLPMNHILLRNRTVVGVEWATWITTNTHPVPASPASL